MSEATSFIIMTAFIVMFWLWLRNDMKKDKSESRKTITRLSNELELMTLERDALRADDKNKEINKHKQVIEEQAKEIVRLNRVVRHLNDRHQIAYSLLVNTNLHNVFIELMEQHNRLIDFPVYDESGRKISG